MADMWEERFKSGPVDERQKSKALVVKVFKTRIIRSSHLQRRRYSPEVDGMM